MNRGFRRWAYVMIAMLVCCAVTSVTLAVMPVSTYSIVAIDKVHNQIGVAVQSSWFCVGPDVIWIESGVGAIATQALLNREYGAKGLELLKAGKTAPDVLAALLKLDDGREVRQVAIIDRNGLIAAHTGNKCIPLAGHNVGKTYSVQANIMANDRVWPAMAEAFEKSSGDLADRLLTTLQAAQKAGGDMRGKQSAAMKIVMLKPMGDPWDSTIVDLRVDDHPDPLTELSRLLTQHKAYQTFYHGEDALEKGDFAKAMKLFAEANELSGQKAELKFWQAVDLAEAGALEHARERLVPLIKEDERWLILLKRLASIGFFPDDAAFWQKLTPQTP